MVVISLLFIADLSIFLCNYKTTFSEVELIDTVISFNSIRVNRSVYDIAPGHTILLTSSAKSRYI